jgi:hypothetical protein
MRIPDPTFSARLMAAEAPPRRRRTARRMRTATLVAVTLLIPGLLCMLSALQLGPAWAAHEGRGTPGTWTATALQCQKNCTWVGTFTVPTTAHTYTDPAGAGWPAYSFIAPAWGYELDGMTLDGGPGIDHVGQSVAAVDTGGPGIVFPRGGGDAWLKELLLTAGSGAAVLLWLWMLPGRALLRLRRRSTDRRGAGYVLR